MRLSVRLTPRAGLDRIDRVADGVVHARVAAPPIDGAANEALVRLIATELGVKRTSVRLATGASGRTKVVEVEGLTAEELRARRPDLGV